MCGDNSFSFSDWLVRVVLDLKDGVGGFRDIELR